MNIVLAAFAFGTLITAILTFRQTREFEKQRIRPMMQAHLRMAEDPYFCAELVISNPGQTIAHNVKFEFLPDLPKTPPQRKHRPNKNPSMAPKPTRHHPTTTPWRTNPNLGPRLRKSKSATPTGTKTNPLQRYLRTQRRTTLRHHKTQNPSTQNPNRPTKHPPRTKITPRRMWLPRSKQQQPALKTFPNSPLAHTQQRAGWGLYLCPWHQAADPTTKFDDT